VKTSIVAALAGTLFFLVPAQAADQKMTGAQLTALLSQGKTLTLGGPGTGMSGELTISADGTAVGHGQGDKGFKFDIEGVWKIKGDQFCRTWKGGRDSGKEVCETWIVVAPNKAKIMANGKDIGLKSW
jgi:hypothetical protein